MSILSKHGMPYSASPLKKNVCHIDKMAENQDKSAINQHQNIKK
jgi:hypothetical protein